MQCNGCPFQQPIYDATFVDTQGNHIPVYRCRAMSEFKTLTNVYCDYSLNTSRFYKDVQALGNDYKVMLDVKHVTEKLEEADSTTTTVHLSLDEIRVLVELLEQPSPHAVKQRQHLSSRLSSLTKPEFRLTISECMYLVNLIHNVDPILKPYKTLTGKLTATIG